MCAYPTFVAFRFVCVVSPPDELSRPSVVDGNACLHCSPKQLMGKVNFREENKWQDFPEYSSDFGTQSLGINYSYLFVVDSSYTVTSWFSVKEKNKRHSLTPPGVFILYNCNPVISEIYRFIKTLFWRQIVWFPFCWKYGVFWQKLLTSLLFHILWTAETR